MSWIKENLGLDWFDLLVHVTLSGIVMGIVGETGGRDEAVMAIGGASLLLLALRRSWALRRRGLAPGITSGEMAAMRFEEMEHRLAELEASQARVAELEERLEFAERLLAEPTAERMLQPIKDVATGARE